MLLLLLLASQGKLTTATMVMTNYVVVSFVCFLSCWLFFLLASAGYWRMG